MAELRQAAELAETSATLHALLGYRELKLTNLFLADRHTRRALELAGDEPVVIWCRAAALARQGESNAVETFDKAHSLTSALLHSNGPLSGLLADSLVDWQKDYLNLLLQKSQTNQARLLGLEMADQWEALTQRAPTNADYQRSKARAYGQFAQVERSCGTPAAYLDAQHKSLASWRQVLRLAAREGDKAALAKVCGDLSFHEVLNGHPKEAVATAKEGLAADPSQGWIKSNQAHGYLFTGQFEKAKAIYVATKDLKWPSGAGGTTFGDEVLNDFKTFRQKGLTHPDMEKIEALLRTKSPNDGGAAAAPSVAPVTSK
jgi:hypothetical protein